MKLPYKKLSDNFFFYLLLIYLATSMFCIYMGYEAGWTRVDSNNYHIPYIKKVIDNGFWNAFLNPIPMMPPFYHFIVGIFYKFTGIEVALSGKLISFATSFFTLCFLNLFLKKRNIKLNLRCFFYLVIFLSWHFMSSSVAVVTDAFSFSIYLLLLLYLEKNCMWVVSCLASALIFSRQSYAIVPIALLVSGVILYFSEDKKTSRNVSRSLMYSSILGIVSLGIIMLTWGDFVPPKYKGSRLNPNVINLGAVSLSIAYLGYLFLFAWILRVFSFSKKDLLKGSLLSLLVFFYLPTDYSLEKIRFGSIFWTISKYTYWYKFSFIFWFCGSWFFAFCIKLQKFLSLKFFDKFVLIYSFLSLGFLGVFFIQSYSWQRYIDPMLGVTIIFLFYHMTLNPNCKKFFSNE